MSNDAYRPPEIPAGANLPVADPSGKLPSEQPTGLWSSPRSASWRLRSITAATSKRRPSRKNRLLQQIVEPLGGRHAQAKRSARRVSRCNHRGHDDQRVEEV